MKQICDIIFAILFIKEDDVLTKTVFAFTFTETALIIFYTSTLAQFKLCHKY